MIVLGGEEDKKKAVERVSAERIQAAAKKYLGRQYIDAVLYPDPKAMAEKEARGGAGKKAKAKKVKGGAS